MKSAWTAFLISVGLLCGHPALAQHQVDLHGSANVPGDQVAFLKVDKESWAAQTGDHFQGWTKGKHFPIDVLEVDLTNEIFKTRIDGVDYTNSLPRPDRPATAKSWIHLQNVDFKQAMDLYGRLCGRTILLHPYVLSEPFSCEASWADESPAKTEVIACISKALDQRNASSLEDGDCFLQIIPSALAQTATLDAKAPPTSKTEMIQRATLDTKAPIQPGMVDFQGVEISQALDIYGRLVGRQRKDHEPRPMATINFKTTCPLSKAQVIYAFETLFRWNGTEIVLNDDLTFSAVKISGQTK